MKSPIDNELRSPALITAVIAAVQFLYPFMMSAVGIALPAIGHEFQAGAVKLGLVEMIYILAMTLFMLPAGRFADLYGRKQVFIGGLVIFSFATISLPYSPGINFFIGLRFIQGLGAAMAGATCFAILSASVPAKKRGAAMGIVVAAVYAGISMGATLAGFVVSHVGWRWLFYSGFIIQIFALIPAIIFIQGPAQHQRKERSSFDWSGSLIYMAALSTLIFGTMHLKENLSYRFVISGGIAGIIIFLFWEYRSPSPILNIQLLMSNRVFTMSNIATLINYAASFGVTFFFSLYLQQVKGLTPQAAGMILVTQAITQAILSPITGRISDKISPPKLATFGMIICSVGLFLCATVDAESSNSFIFAALLLMGLGFALFSSPNMTTVMGSVEPKFFGIASSLVSTMRTIGMLTAMTIITLILSVFMGDVAVSPDTVPSYMTAMKTGFYIFSGISVIGVFCSMGRMKQG